MDCRPPSPKIGLNGNRLIMTIYRIRRLPGSKPEVSISLADNICAAVTGISEQDKLNLVRNSATSQSIPKEHKFTV